MLDVFCCPDQGFLLMDAAVWHFALSVPAASEGLRPMVWACGKQAGQRPCNHATCWLFLGAKKTNDIVQLTEIIGLVKPAVVGLGLLDPVC
jgi:hypothetical protein